MTKYTKEEPRIRNNQYKNMTPEQKAKKVARSRITRQLKKQGAEIKPRKVLTPEEREARKVERNICQRQRKREERLADPIKINAAHAEYMREKKKDPEFRAKYNAYFKEYLANRRRELGIIPRKLRNEEERLAAKQERERKRSEQLKAERNFIPLTAEQKKAKANAYMKEYYRRKKTK